MLGVKGHLFRKHSFHEVLDEVSMSQAIPGEIGSDPGVRMLALPEAIQAPMFAPLPPSLNDAPAWGRHRLQH